MLSEERKRKISEFHKGKKHSDETKRKMSEKARGNKFALGKHWHLPEETKQKISKANLGKKLTEETKRKLKGRKKSEEHKRKISQSLKGRILSEETKKKISFSLSGEKSPFWQGGKSFEPYSTDWTKTLKRSIRERDKYTCQICGKEPAIHCHHIDYDKQNCNPENLITLCHTCHNKTNQNRNYWINYFKKS
jgi:hypothetical protein